MTLIRSNQGLISLVPQIAILISQMSRAKRAPSTFLPLPQWVGIMY
jgi:hypothetical protein